MRDNTSMQRLASTHDGKRQYLAFERPQEVLSLELKELGYFRRALGMSEYRATFQSWVAGPEPVLLGCLAENTLLGWCMFERWDRSDADKTPIHVLRMIEVGGKHRGQKIGLNLMTLTGMIAPGHLVTRPLSAASERFFQRLGFIRPPEEAQVDFHDKYGYLLLPAQVKHRLFGKPLDDGLALLNDAITRCSDRLKTAVLRGELSQAPSFAQAFMSAVARPAGREDGAEKSYIKTDTARFPCSCGSIAITFYTLPGDDGAALSVECERCGNVWLTVPV